VGLSSLRAQHPSESWIQAGRENRTPRKITDFLKTLRQGASAKSLRQPTVKVLRQLRVRQQALQASDYITQAEMFLDFIIEVSFSLYTERCLLTPQEDEWILAGESFE
jgi:hypothetical protein